jgi:predicted N-acyltransferase
LQALLNISILNPIEHPNWDDLLLTTDRATFFHTTAWARVLSESYGYKPLYFAIIDNGKLAGLIPVMEIDSFLTGKRGVSLPFTDACHSLADTTAVFQALIRRLTEYGNHAGWKYIEFRGGGDFIGGVPSCEEYFTHILDMDGDEEGLFKSFRGNIRNEIRKSQKEGITVSLLHTREAMTTFYHMHCRTRRGHGLPPQPWSFFENIYEHVIVSRQGFVALADYHGIAFAGAVYFLFQDCALYKFSASERRFQHLQANKLLMWEAIRWFCRNGFHSLDFGRSDPANTGLLQFKRGWRATETRVANYRFDLKQNAFSADGGNIKSSYSVCKVLPLPVLRLAGRVLYRHVG